MDSKPEFSNILEFFQTRREDAPGDISYDSEFCQCLLKTFPAAEASIWKLDQNGLLHFSFGTHIASDDISDISLRSGEGIGGAVVLSRKARERIEDIPLLANHFLRNLLSAEEGPGPAKPSAISDLAVGILKAVEWPGNVRQLEQAVQAA